MPLEEMIWNRKIRGFYNPRTEVYVSHRKQKHFCIKYHGWGIQKVIVERLTRRGCKTIRIEFEDSDGKLKPIDTPFSNYITNGITDWLNKCDGIQVFLHQEFFKPMKKPNLFGW